MPRRPGYLQIPAGIWALGFVSLLMDVSSEMIHALLPVYLVTTLGASMLAVGLIEGIAEATASIVKVFSGALSDWLGKRKLLVVLGYGLAAFTKPVFPLATSAGWVVAARFVDRIGKGLRGAPRDALMADLAPPELRGASFGLRQSLDTIGAFVGPAIAIALMALTAENIRLTFWAATLPAFMALALLVFWVREPKRPAGLRQVRLPFSGSELARLGPAFWTVTAIAAAATLARFSEAFLVLKAQAAGLPVLWIPLVLVLMNIVYALSAYPAGALSDRIGRSGVLKIGLGLLIAADLLLAASGGWASRPGQRRERRPALLSAATAAGIALWGLHMGFTQGVFATMVADAAPAELRATAFGIFNLASGLALLAASLLAGALWYALGPDARFAACAGVAAVALAALSALPTPAAREPS